MKNILIITNSFPPGGGSGMLRTMKFVQYLPSYGWLPVILSIHDKYNEKKDYSVLRNISDKVVVYRSVLWDPLGFFRDIGPKMPIKKSNDLRFDDCQGNKGISLRSQLIKKVKKGISNCFTTPDKFIGWLIPGLIMGFFLYA